MKFQECSEPTCASGRALIAPHGILFGLVAGLLLVAIAAFFVPEEDENRIQIFSALLVSPPIFFGMVGLIWEMFWCRNCRTSQVPIIFLSLLACIKRASPASGSGDKVKVA